MLLTVAIAVLAACGVFLIAWTLFEALMLPPSEGAFLVVYLRGDAGLVQQTVRAYLRLRRRRGFEGSLIFVDGGLDAEGQTSVELLLRREPSAILCAEAQLQGIIGEQRNWSRN